MSMDRQPGGQAGRSLDGWCTQGRRARASDSVCDPSLDSQCCSVVMTCKFLEKQVVLVVDDCDDEDDSNGGRFSTWGSGAANEVVFSSLRAVMSL